MNKIPNLNEILTTILDVDEELVDQSVDSLVPPGENMGSEIISVDIKLRNKRTQTERVVNAVAKLPPPSEFLQKIFNTPVTFQKEIELYTKIVPCLHDFQLARRDNSATVFDGVPKYLGSRFTVNPKNTKYLEDDTSSNVLLLENLKAANYRLVDRLTNLDLPTTEIILKNLAEFHGIPIALQLLEPDVFQRDIKPYLRNANAFEGLDRDQFFRNATKPIEGHAECIPLIPRIRKSCETTPGPVCSLECTNLLFATISHNDLWMNNVMVKYDEDSHQLPVAVKFLDFQLYNYGPVSRDVICLLFTSVQLAVLEKNLDYFLDFYYKSFISCLDSFKCNTSRFSFDAFIDDINVGAKKGAIIQILHLLTAVFLEPHDIQNLDKISSDSYNQGPASLDHTAKAVFVVKEFAKRNWI